MMEAIGAHHHQRIPNNPTASGPSADGLGPSLELKDFAADNALAASWGIVTGKRGTPGAVNGNFSGTAWTSTGGGGGTTVGPVRTHPAGTWTGDTSPMLNSLDAASTDTNYWQYFEWDHLLGLLQLTTLYLVIMK